ncbi:MAG: hypothetical protein H6713_35485 [Myxococcales bacterium]|nr:hypothetical protein [Myxococcales bacterium]
MLRLDRERRRSNELLRVILPDAIAEELRTHGSVRPRRHERVAVLFADVVGFTAYCERRPPEDVIKPLQQLISAFEQLAAERGVQKIKTIGDSFMAACGLHPDDDDPVRRCVELGMAMTESIRRHAPEWDVRVGVHVGPVVSGIVGERQYLYDIWGDTVNTAQRIEAHGVVGRVCVSRLAWDELGGRFAGRSRGPVEVKGKGSLEIFELHEARGERPKVATRTSARR